MTAKKKITSGDIIDAYMEYILENDEQPKSVNRFAKENIFDEANFYEHFGTFDAVESKIFSVFFDNTVNVLNKTEDYQKYDPRHKLLSFYFTFFEILTANRSYVIYALRKHKTDLKSWKALSELKSAFGKYIDDLNIESLDLKEDKLMKVQEAAIRNAAWMQLILTMKFWMDDSSAAFEKTDIYIEKSVNTSFDLLNTKPLQSLIDFGKFLWKEKMYSNA